MIGREIVCPMDPRGKSLEGFISGTGLRPGTIMQIKAGTPPRGNRLTWEAYNKAADAAPGLIAVLNKDYLNGNRDHNSAYANGDRCFLYCPIPGEDINVRVAGAYAVDIAIGDEFSVDDGTGHLIAGAAAPAPRPFQAIEAFDADDIDDTNGTCVCMIFTGY